MDCRTDAIFEVVLDHVQRHVGMVAHVLHTPGPEIVHVDVLHVAPTPGRPWHTLITCGMSRRPMCPPEEAEDCHLAELFLCLPPEWPVRVPDADPRNIWPIVELSALARLPHLAECWVWHGHTIGGEDPNEPIAPGVGFTAWILGPHLSLRHRGCIVPLGEKRIHLFSALPIYPEELDLARVKGPQALFDLFASRGVADRIQIGRPSCVTGQVPGR